MSDSGSCRFCGKPLKNIYPDAPPALRWSHTSAAAAAACPSSGWPIPIEQGAENA